MTSGLRIVFFFQELQCSTRCLKQNKEIKQSWARQEKFATNFEISEFCCFIFLEVSRIQCLFH